MSAIAETAFGAEPEADGAPTQHAAAEEAAVEPVGPTVAADLTVQKQKQCTAAASSRPSLQQSGEVHPLRPVTAADFAVAMKRVGPSMARGAAVEFEPIRWADDPQKLLLTGNAI